jgi:hypothetical protein
MHIHTSQITEFDCSKLGQKLNFTGISFHTIIVFMVNGVNWTIVADTAILLADSGVYLFPIQRLTYY